MKKLFVFMASVMVVLVLMGTLLQAQTSVTKWGFLGGRQGNWSFTPGAAGGASIGGTASLSIEWGAIRGEFDSPVTATTTSAVVVTGTIEFVGAGIDTWSGLRYGLFNHTAAGTLITSPVDSTRWSGSESSSSGYMFTPISGTNSVTDGASGGIGTQWVRVSGNYISTSTGSGPIRPAGVITQKPVRAVADAGVYEFAFCVQPLADGTKEVRFYLIKGTAAQSTKATYYFGGSFIDTTTIASTFNGVVFAAHAAGSGPNPNLRGVKLSNVKVSTGTPLVVPDAPWVAYYVSDWGFIGGLGGTSRINGWKYIPDPNAIIGNASIGGSGPQASKSGWSAIRGGFPEPFTATNARPILVTGKIEFVGSGFQMWSNLRYGLFMHDSAGSLIKTSVDSTRWSGYENRANGYMFTPHSGKNDQVGWSVGGNGTQGVTVNGNWISSFGSNVSLGVNNQKPARAEGTAGVYDFAISVKPQADGSKDVTFYMIKQGTPTTYWYGGTVKDVTTIPPVFNGVCFAVNGQDTLLRSMKLTDIKVDIGSVTVPEAPWVAYFIDQWGFLGGRMYGWNFIPDPFGMIGNAGIGGTASNQKWAAIRGGFFDPIAPTTAKALVLTGKVELVGGGYLTPGSFRFGTFYSDQAGKVILDSAKATLPDSTRWDGLETYTSGYLFVPPSGTTGLFKWDGVNQSASAGGVVNGAWLHTDYPATGGLTNNYTLGTDVQTPASAPITAGVYDFIITVAAKSATSNDVRWKLSKGTSYSITGKLTDTRSPLATTKFNSVNFAVSGDAQTTGLKLTDVKVDYVDVAAVPIASVSGVTSVEGTGSGVPTAFGLEQNYPNPFNPSTTIRYDVAKPAYVTIRVYDVLGRMVAQLVNGAHAASNYVVQWSPSGLSSGTYLYRIDARNEDGSGTFSAVKKLILMK